LDSLDVRRLLPLLLLMSTGCTAVKSGVVLVQAEQALMDAEAARAQAGAVYEYTLADLYRDKAREEWAASQFAAAEELAARAVELADEAREKAEFGLDEGTLEQIEAGPLPEDQEGALWDP